MHFIVELENIMMLIVMLRSIVVLRHASRYDDMAAEVNVAAARMIARRSMNKCAMFYYSDRRVAWIRV